MNPIFQQFMGVSLPIMVTLVATIWIAQWGQNKRFDDLNKRIDDLGRRIDDLKNEVNKRLDRIEAKLDSHEQRIVRIEERTSLLHR